MIERGVLWFWCAVLVLSVFSGGAAASSGPQDYRIGAGDVLVISVWKDESLTRQVVVLPDGTISFPLIGCVQAEGKALQELKQVIMERLARFVPDPILSLDVVQVRSLAIYIIGKVGSSGRFDLTGNINILQALSLAGGLNPYADSKGIKVFRETEEGTRILKFNYKAVSRGEQLEQNIQLERGDVIVVP